MVLLTYVLSTPLVHLSGGERRGRDGEMGEGW